MPTTRQDLNDRFMTLTRPVLAGLLSFSILTAFGCAAEQQAHTGPGGLDKYPVAPQHIADSGQDATDPVVALLQDHRETAIEQIQSSAQSENRFMRMNAIEAMQPVPERAAELVEPGLDDEAAGVRFAALMTVGELELEAFADHAERMAREDERAVVRAAAMFASKRLGREIDISEMAEMMAAPQPSLRSNVAMLLGRMGDPSAIPMMEQLAHTPMPRAAAEEQALMRLQVAEAMVKLGREDAIEPIRAAGWSHFDEVRVLGLSLMGQMNDRRMAPAIRQKLQPRPDGEVEPIELRLAAAEALARMSADRDGEALETMLEAAGATADSRFAEHVPADQLAAVRAQAAHALGLVNANEAIEKLVSLLKEDEAEQVRLAAAAAVLKALEQSG